MSKKRKIGWQKYEDLLDQQLNNNFLMKHIQHQMNAAMQNEESSYEYEEEAEEEAEGPLVFPMSQQLFNDAAMLSNYDCWVGHTNFDITKDIQSILDKIDGIEVLKVCSRYRFFIGVGRMFEFKNVRNLIEKEII